MDADVCNVNKAGPDVPDEPLVPELPDVPDDPEVPEVPDEPLVPDVPLEPDVPEDPEVPDEPDVPDVPLEPDVPDVPDEPEVPEVPDEPEVPDIEPPFNKIEPLTFKLPVIVVDPDILAEPVRIRVSIAENVVLPETKSEPLIMAPFDAVTDLN